MAFLTFAVTSFAAIFSAMLAFLGVTKIADEVFGASPAAQKFADAVVGFDLRPSFSRAYVNATYMSDATYGARLLSVRAVLVSAGVSVAWFLLLMGAALYLEGRHVWFLNPLFRGAVLHQFWYFFLIGIGVDFLSVCLTRRLLLFAVDKNTAFKVLVLGLDIVLSALLFCFLFEGSKYLIYPEQNVKLSLEHVTAVFPNWTSYIFQLELINKFLHDATIVPLGNGQFEIQNGETEVIYAFPEGMAFFASMLTSFWILVHIAAYIFFRAASQISTTARSLIKHSSIKIRPFMSVGTIACLLVLIPLWVFCLVAWLYVHS